MQLSNIPGKLVLPFANSGGKNSIPVDSQIGITAGAASLTDGFPPLTMTPLAAGGVPPSGLDMNGILYEMSAILRWANAGGGYAYDSAFATDSNVGGYPKGARVLRSDGQGYWFNTVDSNTTDPEAAGAAAAGWVPDYQAGAAAITMTSANVTLTPAQYGKALIVITGALTTNLNLIFPAIVKRWTIINGTSGSYSITAKTSGGSGVAIPQGFAGSIDGDGTNIYSRLADLANSSDSTKGASFIGWLRSVAGAVGTALATWLGWQRPTIFEFMTPAEIADYTAGTASIDIAAKIQAAIDVTSGKLRLPVGSGKIGSQLVIRNSCTGIVGEGQYTSTLQKAFNGEAISVNTSGAELSNFAIVGNSATYSGGGIKPVSYDVKLTKLRITDTADSCVIFDPAVGSNALAGTYCVVEDCFLNPANPATTFAIRSTGTDDSTRPTDRKFNRISGGSTLVDFSGMNLARLTNSLGTNVKFNNNCSKIHMAGNRLTCSDIDITIYGQDHAFDGNFWGFNAGHGVTLDSTSTAVYWGPTNDINIGSSSFQSIKENAAVGAAGFNSIFTELKSFVTQWKGSTTNGSFGTGNVDQYYVRTGRRCKVHLGFIRDASMTNPTGTWSFLMPYKAYIDAVGTVQIKGSDGTYRAATCQIIGGGNVAYVYLQGGTAAMQNGDIPFSTNGIFSMDIDYLVAPT